MSKTPILSAGVSDVNKSKTILTIEDDPIIRQALVNFLLDLDFQVLEASDGEQGLEIIRQQLPDLVMTDLRLPKVDGLQILAIMREEYPDTPVIIVSGMGTIEDVIKALKFGAWDYLTKPITDMALVKHGIDKALEKAALLRENRHYQQHLEHEVQRRTAELHQAQKLEAVGTLAGGIAHDFNNILSAVMGFTDLALLKAADLPEIKYDLEQVKQASIRARDLVAQILTFSRKTEVDRQPVIVYSLVKETLKLLRASIHSTAEIQQDIDETPARILISPVEVHQLLMNLCTNASQALPDEIGIIQVSLKPVIVDQALADHLPDLKTGKYLLLKVSDNGLGMDQKTLQCVFEPFFTTKPTGKGTGLGLSVVHGIVGECGAAIAVKSEPGQGTEFSIYFPQVDVTVQAEEEVATQLPGGDERILFVDDEPSVMKLGERMLTYLGYQVTLCSSGVQALSLIEENPAAYDLIVTDQTMPQLTGFELCKKVKMLRPDLPVILCTGHSSVINKEKALAGGASVFLMKPLAIQTLATEIRRLLNPQKKAS